jgi:hypothetical protein
MFGVFRPKLGPVVYKVRFLSYAWGRKVKIFKQLCFQILSCLPRWQAGLKKNEHQKFGIFHLSVYTFLLPLASASGYKMKLKGGL